jgi:hypothetical protein
MIDLQFLKSLQLIVEPLTRLHDHWSSSRHLSHVLLVMLITPPAHPRQFSERLMASAKVVLRDSSPLFSISHSGICLLLCLLIWSAVAHLVCSAVALLVCSAVAHLVCSAVALFVCSAVALLVCSAVALLVCSAVAHLVCSAVALLVCYLR